MGILDFFSNRKGRWRYTKREAEACEDYIQEQYGKISSVIHELVSPDIHLDIAVIAPSEASPFYTLVTVGMGAHKMNVPKELKGETSDRAELVMHLPKSWKLDSSDEKDYWPIRNMKMIGRLPIDYNTWLGCGHTVATREEKPFAENTKLNGTILLDACDRSGNSMKVTLPGGKKIAFFILIPLYQEEMEFKLSHSTDELMKLFNNQVSSVLDIHRKNQCVKSE